VLLVGQSVEPLILSVGEEEEVSIADVATNVAKAMEFSGAVVVRAGRHGGLMACHEGVWGDVRSRCDVRHGM
jgi:hypothetical protein